MAKKPEDARAQQLTGFQSGWREAGILLTYWTVSQVDPFARVAWELAGLKRIPESVVTVPLQGMIARFERYLADEVEEQT